MSYAESTRVPVERSQGEIRKILGKYNATGFAYAESLGKSMIMFEMAGRRIQIILPMPVRGVTKNHKGYVLDQKSIDQMSRSRWRALVLVIKAKMECVESGITTLEQEFLAHIMLPNGQTVGTVMLPQIARSYQHGKMPPLLGYEGDAS